MPRYNVYNYRTNKWRCFSSIVDDYVTDEMNLDDYEAWRKQQYGNDCGSVYDANIMSLEEAEATIKWRHENEDYEEQMDIYDTTKSY